MLSLLFDIVSSYTFYVILLFVAPVYLLLFRSAVISIFDPLVMTITNFVFAGSLVLWMYRFDYIDIRYLVSYVLCVVAFVVGFKRAWPESILAERHVYSKREPRTIRAGQGTDPHPSNCLDFDHLYLFAMCLALISIGATIYGFTSNSIAIFSENPIYDRVAISANNRLLTVVSSASNPIGLIIAMLLMIFSKIRFRRVVCSAMIPIFLFYFVGIGSKSAVVGLIFLVGTLQIYLRSIGCSSHRALSRIAYILIPAGIAYFIYVTSTPGASNVPWHYQLMFRLAASGDTYIYLFAENQYEYLKYTYNVITYLLHTFTTVFGVKFIPYNIGVALYGGSTGDYSGYGPNSHYTAEGMIFFGLYGAPFYSFAAGYITAHTRRLRFGVAGNRSFVIFMVLFYNSAVLPLDVTLWLFYVISFAVVLTVPFIITSVVSRLISEAQFKKQPSLVAA